ncbi:MAG TPA: putative lipid II flippase FtsW [Motiliproteus sp.]
MNLPLSLPWIERAGAEIRTPGAFDPWLLFSALCLLVLGGLMITSASMEVADVRYGSPFDHAGKHLLFMLVGLVFALVVFFIPMPFWYRTGHWWLLVGFVLLVAVLIIGREVNGSVRWIRLGPVNIQASELAKLCVIVYTAGYLVRRLEEVRTQWSGFLKPMLVVGVYIVLLLLEPDFGAVVVMTCTVLGMIFLGGMKLGQFLLVVIGSFIMVAVVAVAEPYRVERLTSFLNPWADPFGAGYQLAQAQIAFGRGEWFGLGLGNSVQKLFYLPEAHTDFVFSVLAEELGLVGALAVVVLFAILVVRVFAIGRRAEELGLRFQAYIAYGFGLVFAGQALINIGVNVGVLPTKGLTLPLVSYGGSSLVVSLGMLALLCRIHLDSNLAEQALDEEGDA